MVTKQKRFPKKAKRLISNFEKQKTIGSGREIICMNIPKKESL
ncbi:hypothetical protein LEP1GSC061_3936 [Leptospira wolffii serovar Khorat str. Khorat-H2]|nr:hypothetical protein LEP1GSC061_3936 [Leptospira wolffii serovar Khorat str. Khorat-H2]